MMTLHFPFIGCRLGDVTKYTATNCHLLRHVVRLFPFIGCRLGDVTQSTAQQSIVQQIVAGPRSAVGSASD